LVYQKKFITFEKLFYFRFVIPNKNTIKLTVLKKIFHFYYRGFTDMPHYGKQVWTVIIIKLAIMFLVFKVFFFKDKLSQYKTTQDKANHVIEQLIKTK